MAGNCWIILCLQEKDPVAKNNADLHYNRSSVSEQLTLNMYISSAYMYLINDSIVW